MTLVIITVILILVSAVIGGCSSSMSVDEGIITGLFIGMLLFGGFYVVSQFFAMVINTQQIPQHTETKIVAIQDNSQVEGHFSGGLFIVQGSIGEVQYFSYYKDNGDGSFSLDKQLADHSVIVQDATPETAHLSSESTLTHCVKKWWSTWGCADSGIYNHGVFHVPPNSISNNFNLDAK